MSGNIPTIIDHLGNYFFYIGGFKSSCSRFASDTSQHGVGLHMGPSTMPFNWRRLYESCTHLLHGLLVILTAWVNRLLDAGRQGEILPDVMADFKEFTTPGDSLPVRAFKKGRGARTWTEAEMAKALALVRKGELTYRAASQRFNIPHQTIYSRLKEGKADTTHSVWGIACHRNSYAKIRNPSLLTQEENSVSSFAWFIRWDIFNIIKELSFSVPQTFEIFVSTPHWTSDI